MSASTATFTRRQQSRALIALCCSVALMSVDITIVNVALPAIGESLNATEGELQWVLDAFNVVMAGAVLLCSGLGDRYGRKLILLLGLAIFAFGSLLASLAPSIGVLISARAVMGLGVAMVMPATFSLLAVIFPPERRAFAIGIWAAVGGIMLALGPVIGGILLELFSWPAIFTVSIPIAIFAIIAGILLLPESKELTGERLDYLGALLSLLGLTGVVFALIEGPSLGWTSPIVIGAFFVGVVFIFAFVRWELHTDTPMFEIRTLKIPAVVAGALAVGTMYFVIFTVLYVMPEYLQFVLGFSSSMVGIALLPLGGLFGLLSMFNGRTTAKFGIRNTMAGGIFFVALGLLVLAGIGHFGYYTVGVGLALIGIGWAGCLSPSTAVIMDALPVKLAGSGSSINQVSRLVGGAFGVAIVGSVVTAVFTSGIGQLGLAPEVAQRAERSLGAATETAQTVPSAMSAELLNGAALAFEQAARTGFLIAAALTILSASLTLFAVKNPPAPVTEQAADQSHGSSG
jgi:DHA2 family multidrug resistance protein-like MFS transporter